MSSSHCTAYHTDTDSIATKLINCTTNNKQCTHQDDNQLESFIDNSVKIIMIHDRY